MMKEFVTAVATVAMIGWAIRPNNNSQAILTAHSDALKMMIRTTTNPELSTADRRTEAEKYAEQASTAIGEFWQGFGEYWDAEW